MAKKKVNEMDKKQYSKREMLTAIFGAAAVVLVVMIIGILLTDYSHDSNMDITTFPNGISVEE